MHEQLPLQELPTQGGDRALVYASSSRAELVYSGRAGGTNHITSGGPAEILICLPDDPDYFLGEVPGPGRRWSTTNPSNLAKSWLQCASN